MVELIVPDLDPEPWPTLGPAVCWWIEHNLVHGPGDIRGEPVRLNMDQKAVIYRMYEVHPQDTRQAGRRRFKRCGISWPKGTAKSEFAAFIAAAELHPKGPVRCVGWDGNGNPIGGAVRDPYIPLVAYTEEQSDELCYAALLAILQESRAGKAFDLGLERITRLDGTGRAVSLAGAPNARDGARTTFQAFDEVHRWTRDSLKRAYRTMLANVPKRFMADPWTLEITTAFSPGERSVAEETMDYAKQIADGRITDPVLFYFHRQASDACDASTDEGRRAGVIEARGPYFAAWADIDAIVGEYEDPNADRAYWERVWFNRPVQQGSRAFKLDEWRTAAVEPRVAPDKARICLGLDGNRDHATSLVAVELETGYVWPLRTWSRPSTAAEWEVDGEEVAGTVQDAFERWRVVRMHSNPLAWESLTAELQGRYGKQVVFATRTDTTRRRRWAFAVKAFNGAIRGTRVDDEHRRELTHGSDVVLTGHLVNCIRADTTMVDDDGRPLWLVRQDRPDSTNYIAAAKAAILAWEARSDAIAGGALKPQTMGISGYFPDDEERQEADA